MFFDFHVHGNEKLAKEAKRLGYEGICLVRYSDEYHQAIKKNSGAKTGVEIIAENSDDLKKKIRKFRRKVDILLVHGGNIKINRTACEDPRIDIIAHPYRNRRDCGINHVLAKEAAENGVAVEININYILKFRSSLRSKVLNQFRQILKLQRKFKFPLIITSGAHSIYDLRAPRDIIALTSCFGMAEEEANDGLSKTPITIMEKSKVRKDYIVNGVRVIR